MAHFYGGVHGHRGEATRLGTPRSGLTIFGNGWRVGVRASLSAGEGNDSGTDTVTVYLTSGSGNDGSRVCLGTFSQKDLRRMVARENRKAEARIAKVSK